MRRAIRHRQTSPRVRGAAPRPPAIAAVPSTSLSAQSTWAGCSSARNAVVAAAMPDPKRRVRGPALQVRQNALDLANRGIVRPAVAVASPILVVGVAHERARHVDRRDEAAGGGIGNAARLGGDRLGVEALDRRCDCAVAPHGARLSVLGGIAWRRAAVQQGGRDLPRLCWELPRSNVRKLTQIPHDRSRRHRGIRRNRLQRYTLHGFVHRHGFFCRTL